MKMDITRDRPEIPKWSEWTQENQHECIGKRIVEILSGFWKDLKEFSGEYLKKILVKFEVLWN